MKEKNNKMKLITLGLLIGVLLRTAAFGADDEVLKDPIKDLRKYQVDREESLINTTFPEIAQHYKYDPCSECFLGVTMRINRKKEEALKAMYNEIEEYREQLINQYRNIEFPEIKRNYFWDTYNIRKTDTGLTG